MAAAEPALPTRRRGDSTAKRILDAAEELFAERGFSGTTLRSVAGRVGIRNPSLYNHFDSKEALYAAVLARGISPLLEAITGFLDGEAELDPARVVERVMELLCERPLLPRLILHETLHGGPHLTPILREWIEPTFARAHRMVELTPGAERWRAEQIPLLVLAMYHVVVGYFTIAPLYRELAGEDLLSDEALARQTRFLGDVVSTLFETPEGRKR